MKPFFRLRTKIIFAVVFCAVFLSSFSMILAEENQDPILIGVPADRCPIFYRNEKDGDPVGIGVDLMRIAAEEAGYQAVFEIIQEETLKDALDNGKYDVILPFGSSIESTSGKKTIVSDNLMTTPFTFVRQNSRSLPKIDTMRVGMLHSLQGAIDTLHQKFPEMIFQQYETMDEMVRALRDNQVDALLHNSYVWSYVLQKPGYQDLVIEPYEVFTMDFRAGTLDTPEKEAVIARLNQGIAGITDSQRQAIILDYTSRRLYHYDLSDYLHQYGLVAFLIALLFLSLIIIAWLRIRNLRLEQEEKLQQMIDQDPLTGALSMNGFRKKAEELLQAHPDVPYYLSYSNIRNFKFINDSLGRKAGDDLLKFWMDTTRKHLTEEEAVGRLSGDHFVFLRHLAGEEKMKEDTKNVFEPVENYFIRQGRENRVQVCIGIYVLTPQDYRVIDVDHMIDLARVAEQRVRETHKGDYAFYNPEQWEKEKQVSDIINHLPKALEDGDIQVYYQPQIDYSANRIIGAEALCRWDHAKLGWLQPEGFISTLEKAGLIFDLDSYVWKRVCQDLKRWNEMGIHQAVSVNVSRDDIRDDRDIPEHFRKLTETWGISPDQLRIEITETAFAENPELLITATNQLRALGFKVEMDDFGSGYSSLHMLKEVPVDRIKLDLHFLTGSGDQEKGRTIISCMIQMVHSLGLELIAEGVETGEQADFLLRKGNYDMQGYYFYRPMPVEEFEKLIFRK